MTRDQQLQQDKDDLYEVIRSAAADRALLVSDMSTAARTIIRAGSNAESLLQICARTADVPEHELLGWIREAAAIRKAVRDGKAAP